MPTTYSELERQNTSYAAEILDLRGLVSLLGPAVGNLCTAHPFAHKSDDELTALLPGLVGDIAKNLLEAREAYAEYLAHNKPEPEETTSDDYEPVENWAPERDV